MRALAEYQDGDGAPLKTDPTPDFTNALLVVAVASAIYSSRVVAADYHPLSRSGVLLLARMLSILVLIIVQLCRVVLRVVRHQAILYDTTSLHLSAQHRIRELEMYGDGELGCRPAARACIAIG